ncbi:conserved hypothetical protein [Candida dubliniensis CD36]|uniref:Uncharacterized protein n=1 Tax=Candida dubliniensis (strain CD36 / ATCC MYA-646 / CBS 7987 / NCPF 3949 / NRRL Y-17841) TaxID=573826 RepID=B9WJK4_CANDC|nr:conserved hypothetical protein [Candida dubliniensis CD36]CAX40648.1 conserved hypothetical protein [Candida dubliniensis CD36]
MLVLFFFATTDNYLVMQTTVNWYTYGSNSTINDVTYSLASVSPKKSLECELTIEFLKIIYIIDEAPYDSWQKTIDSCQTIYQSFERISGILINQPNLENNVANFVKNNRLKYILENVILESLKSQISKWDILVHINNLYPVSSLIEIVYDWSIIYSVNIDEELSIVLLCTFQVYRNIEDEKYKSELMVKEIKQRHRNPGIQGRNVNKVILLILGKVKPTFIFFELIKQSILYAKTECEINHLIQDFATLSDNLKQTVNQENDIGLTKIKLSIQEIIIIILKSSYEKINRICFQQVQSDYESIFQTLSTAYQSQLASSTMVQNSDIQPFINDYNNNPNPSLNREDAAEWINNVFCNSENVEDDDDYFEPEFELPKIMTEGGNSLAKPHRISLTEHVKRLTSRGTPKDKSKWHFWRFAKNKRP